MSWLEKSISEHNPAVPFTERVRVFSVVWQKNKPKPTEPPRTQWKNFNSSLKKKKANSSSLRNTSFSALLCRHEPTIGRTLRPRRSNILDIKMVNYKTILSSTTQCTGGNGMCNDKPRQNEKNVSVRLCLIYTFIFASVTQNALLQVCRPGFPCSIRLLYVHLRRLHD